MADGPRITRRSLFRGLGSATVVAGCATPAKPTPNPETNPPGVTPPADGTALGPGPAPLQFTLNGEAKTVEAAPSATLADLLRHEVDATGTKVVCDRGACGACTVMIDGVARPSCMTLAHDVAGRRVTTVEGLAEGGELSPLQAAFVRHDALQCGFCTSGMLMSCQALLSRTRSQALAADDVKRAISGNLCRCGTYPNVVAAVLSVADRKAG
ncbi:MAG: (2Fe-2S)-binding protein [Myxococcales bacterium]|nr:(2Fe-2S)-binding protein [Myxococcales bacterium]